MCRRECGGAAGQFLPIWYGKWCSSCMSGVKVNALHTKQLAMCSRGCFVHLPAPCRLLLDGDGDSMVGIKNIIM